MTLFTRAHCAFVGHDWETNLPSGHSWCNRCERYDDHPAIVRGEGVGRVLRKRSPVWVSVRRRDLSMHIGLQGLRRWLPVSLHVRLHWGWNAKGGELPGAGVDLNIWRLRLYASVGSFWQDEDGENRDLFHVGGSFQTYEIPNLACALFGHRPSPASASLVPGLVYCCRCDKTLERADADPRKAAACTCGGRHTNVDGNGGHAISCPARPTAGITA